jgi:hypothetical protein
VHQHPLHPPRGCVAPVHRAYLLSPEDEILWVGTPDVPRLLVPATPTSLRREILSDAHDSAYNAHLGIDKTHALLASSWFWLNLWKDCRIFVTSCHSCQAQMPWQQDLQPSASRGIHGFTQLSRSHASLARQRSLAPPESRFHMPALWFLARLGVALLQLPPLFSVACCDSCAPNPRLQPTPYYSRTARSQRIEGSLNPSPSSTEPKSTGTAAQLRWGADSPSTRCTPRSAAT